MKPTAINVASKMVTSEELGHISVTLARLERTAQKLEAGAISAQEAAAQTGLAREKCRAGQVRLAVTLACGKKPSRDLEAEFA